MWIRHRFAAALFVFAADCIATISTEQPCRSNATHIAWREEKAVTERIATIPMFRATTKQPISSLLCTCTHQTRPAAENECLLFLRDNLMSFDFPFQETMGFPTNYSTTNAADGLDNGMIGPTISLALDAKVLYPWTDILSKSTFQNYVLNYANLNEARNNWRPLLVDTLRLNESDVQLDTMTTQANVNFELRNDDEIADLDATVSAIVTWVNEVLWTRLGRDSSKPIYFKSSQTPLIFDTMSTIAFGYASCTGTSILFSNALRSVGIASRVVGTPAWYGNASQGNHNWVEVYLPHHQREWKFLEPSPALPHVDRLDKDPCSRWFCSRSRYPASKVYAACLSRLIKPGELDGVAVGEEEFSLEETTHYVPLPWEWDCKDVPGIDRTAYYVNVCGACKK